MKERLWLCTAFGRQLSRI